MVHLCHLQMDFVTNVSIKDHPKINEWLTLVENEMRVTLAHLLAKAVQDVAEFRSGEITHQKYLAWADKYQVRTAVCSVHSL